METILYRCNTWIVINKNDKLHDGTRAILAERFRTDSTYDIGYFVKKENGKYKRVKYYGNNRRKNQ